MQVRYITAARQSITDPDIRFFLTMLLNLPSQSACFTSIEAHHTEVSSHRSCAWCLIALSESDVVLALQRDISNVAKVQGANTGVEIALALERLTEEQSQQSIMGLLEGRCIMAVAVRIVLQTLRRWRLR
uniref:Uncharacterized protein n=1 Tax=Gymnodinialimonas phycosphaerae TaxID=2841589 RepID=A0A975TWD8_9RHOB